MGTIMFFRVRVVVFPPAAKAAVHPSGEDEFRFGRLVLSDPESSKTLCEQFANDRHDQRCNQTRHCNNSPT
jgi:hypothetical protein